MNARSIILTALERFDKRPGNLERLLEHQLRAVTIDHRDRRFVFEIVYGIVRNRMRLDFIITHFLEDKQLVEDKSLMRLLQLGVYQLLYLDRVPDHAAVNETVTLAKQSATTQRFSSIVNAILRKVIAARARLPQPQADLPLAYRLSIEYSHPEWLIQRWLSQFGLARTRKLLAFNNQHPATFLRRRFRGLARASFEAETRQLCTSVGGYHNLFYRLNKSMDAELLDLVQDGSCVVQAPSSGWAVAMMDVQSGQACLDMCSAPGGKATLMAELCGSSGRVYATELREHRLEMLLETMARQNLSAIFPIVCDSSHPPFNALFNSVLLDAPCSGTGVMHRHPDARWIRNLDGIQRITEVQQTLLDAAADLVAPGGTLVYATCSLEEDENQGQVKSFLQRHPQFSLASPPREVLQQYVTLDGYLSITPFEHDLDGMFAARLVKTA